MHTHTHTHIYLSRGHSLCANTVGFGTFTGVFELLVQIKIPKFRPVGGGGYVYTF